MDYKDLRRLALAATQGEWSYSLAEDAYCIASVNQYCVWPGVHIRFMADPEADAAYIAAANPPAVLSLLDACERQQAAIAQAAEMLREARRLLEADRAADADAFMCRAADTLAAAAEAPTAARRQEEAPEARSANVMLRFAKAEAKKRFFGQPGIVGIGIGGGTVRIYVDSAAFRGELPSDIFGVPVEMIRSGPVFPLNSEKT